MTKIKRVLRCFSCGAILQTEHKNLPGYIGKEILENTNPKIPYCNSCYEKIIKLNSVDVADNVDKDIVKVLDDAVATDALIVWSIDISSFNGILSNTIIRKIRNLRLFVIATRRELYSPKIDDAVFIRFIEERFTEAGIKPFSVQIFKEEHNLGDNANSVSIFASINKIREGHDVYMIGSFSSGKSAIVSKFLKDYENKSKWTIKRENYPGTDIKVLEVPLTNSAFFYELPDISLEASIVSKVEKDVLKQIIPHKPLEITSKTLSEKEAIMVGNLGVFELCKGKSTKINLYAAQGVEYKKVNAEKIDETLKDNFKRRNIRPVSERYSLFTDFDVYDLTFEKDNQYHDISITGLVTASFLAKGQTIRVTLPKGVALKESLAKIR